MGFRNLVGGIGIVAICSGLAGLWVGNVRYPAPLHAPAGPQRGDAKPNDGPRDLYGNPLAAAVATYQMDAFGDAVEEHYPDTPVPRLRAAEG